MQDLRKSARLASKVKMEGMAKVAVQDAQQTAVAKVNAPGAAIAKGGLEVEDGCLVYSFDVKVPGKSGVEEVIIDAGNGKVLKTEHEN
ncbi:MAG: PepSY domain-containing protein [Betaproteobacteria bacterium]